MSAIPKVLRDAALKHAITVRRDAHGDYTVWDSTDPASVRWPLHHMTVTGAKAAIRKLVSAKAARYGKTIMAASRDKNPKRKRRAPRMRNPSQWVLIATKKGKTFYYAGGARLTTDKPFAMKFASEASAARIKKMILTDFPRSLTGAYQWKTWPAGAAPLARQAM